MPSYCCVPKCTQHGYKDSNGHTVSFFNFPTEATARKKWIHAIRRDEGKRFVIKRTTKVCSLHFRANDIRKSLNGRLYVKKDAVPSKFQWNMESPRKRKAPAAREPLPTKATKNMVSPSTSTMNQPENEVQLLKEEVKCLNDEVMSLNEEILCSKDSLKGLSDEVERLNEEIIHSKDEVKRLNDEIILLKQELQKCKELTPAYEIELNKRNSAVDLLESKITCLKEKSNSLEKENEQLSKCVFKLDRFTSDKKIQFYTGFPNYATFLAVFEFLNPGLQGENIRYCSSSERSVPDDYYDIQDDDDDEAEVTQELQEPGTKKGRPKKLNPITEFFMVMCRLRQGFALNHLAHLFGVANSTISRSFTAWITFMYLKFAEMDIWPSKDEVQETIPEAFKAKYPSTRVIIDCTEVKCEMPSSLLLNSELFSSYKNHTTLKGLIGIAPSGAVTFISQLYTGSVSDREIVIRSGFLKQNFDDGDSVMADKGFTIDDLLPLGTTLNIPPFLGQNGQMSAEDVVKTRQMAALRIHVERSINRIKNYRIWNGVVPLSQFGLINQMWTICAFLTNAQDPLISA